MILIDTDVEIVTDVEIKTYGYSTVFYSDRKNHIIKLIEGIKELQKLLFLNIREPVVDKLADVEMLLSCYLSFTIPGEEFTIKSSGRYDFKLSAMTYINIITLYAGHHYCNDYKKTLILMTQHIYHCFFNIYQDYNISFEETAVLKELKYKFYLNEIIRERYK